MDANIYYEKPTSKFQMMVSTSLIEKGITKLNIMNMNYHDVYTQDSFL
jgi:hypothetical protein